MFIQESELVLNPDGSIYHLNLQPDEIADFIILVGDPGRVPFVSRYFDRIDVIKQHREFLTHTGFLGKRRISVVSTGIGVGGIDVVMNELDALVNVDFKTREIKKNLTSLELVRLGTCGGLHASIALHDIVSTTAAFAFDGLLTFYQQTPNTLETKLLKAAQTQFATLPVLQSLYVATASLPVSSPHFKLGLTFTCPGFFGPQGRRVRAPLAPYDFFEHVQGFQFQDHTVLNFEMETAAILGLARVLGHKAASLSAVVANRITREFSRDKGAATDRLIISLLETL